jgi:hypothetical protein
MEVEQKWLLNERVKIPTTKTIGSGIEIFNGALRGVEEKFGTTYDHLLVRYGTEHSVTLVTPDEHKVDLGLFSPEDLESYEKPIVDDTAGGLRYNDGKTRWDLVDFESLEPMVQVLMYGANKYTTYNPDGSVKSSGANNWKKGLKVLSIFSSMLRHTFSLMRGENNDPESGLPHIGHIQCNALFIAYMLKKRKDLDDRAV